jgi:hypothetical protein
MRDLSGVVGQLRNVREAERKFLELWAVEQEVIVPGLDRVAADIELVGMGGVWSDSPAMNGEDAGFGFGE